MTGEQPRDAVKGRVLSWDALMGAVLSSEGYREDRDWLDHSLDDGVTVRDIRTTLQAYRAVVEALHPVRVGLKVGDTMATAYHEWPEERDLEALRVALLALPEETP